MSESRFDFVKLATPVLDTTYLVSDTMPDIFRCLIAAPRELSLFTATSSAILTVPAILGNTLILVTVWIDPLQKLRSPFNYFLINLVISDLIVGMVSLPIAVWFHIQESYGSVPKSALPVLHLSMFISSAGSILSLVALSIDRYMLITRAVKYRLCMSMKHAMTVALLIWLVAITLPMVYFCVGYIAYLMVHVNVLVLLAGIVLIVDYVFVFRFLRGRAMSTISNDSHEISSYVIDKKMEIERKVTATLFVILLLFFLTMVPTTVIVYILHFCSICNCSVLHVLRDLAFLAFLASSAINPFICLTRLQTFRMSVLKLYRQCCRREETNTTRSL